MIVSQSEATRLTGKSRQFGRSGQSGLRRIISAGAVFLASMDATMAALV